MDINYSNADEWGTDIGFACDAILNSECSLAGGIFHVATGTRNLWEDIDSHLWPKEIQREETFAPKFPELISVRPQTPREQSVSRYLTMNLGNLGGPQAPERACPSEKTTPKENSLKGMQSTPDQIPVSHGTKAESAKTRALSSDSRPKTSGNSDADNRSKFFHLGDYAGIRPYSSASSFQNSQKPPKMPYFPEIMIKMPTAGAFSGKEKADEAFCRKTKKAEQDKKHEENVWQKLVTPNAEKGKKNYDIRQKRLPKVANNTLSSSGKAEIAVRAGKEIKDVKPARKPQVTRQRREITPNMKATVDRQESSQSADRQEAAQDVVNAASTAKEPKGLRRLSVTLRALGRKLRSVFTSCSLSFS